MAVLDSARSRAEGRTPTWPTIAGPDALAAGLDGLLLHDLIAGFTGVDFPVAQMPPGHPFDDRAGLIESAWQHEDPRPEAAVPAPGSPLPWRLLFNSTDADSGCRAVIANRPLWSAADSSGRHRAASPATCGPRPGGGSFDFFARLPCLRDIATVTAAMLSARFPS